MTVELDAPADPPETPPVESVLSPPEADPPLTIIEAHSGWQFIDVNELWRYRELLGILIWRDVKVRYKQTILGAAWAVLQPFATMLVFTLFLRDVAGAAKSPIPYPLFVFCGMLMWTSFANAVTSASNSVVASQNMVTKIYFPRMLIPLGAIGAVAVDVLISSGMLALLMIGYRLAGYEITIGWRIIFAPFLVLALGMAATGLGTLLSALTVAFRDFRHVVPFLVQLWLFATPSIFVQSPSRFGPLGTAALRLNPVHGLVVNFQAAVLNQPDRADLIALGSSLAVSLGLLLFGCLYFRRVERRFADII